MSQSQLTASKEVTARPRARARASQGQPAASSHCHNSRIGKEGTAQVNYVEYVVVCVEKKLTFSLIKTT